MSHGDFGGGLSSMHGGLEAAKMKSNAYSNNSTSTGGESIIFGISLSNEFIIRSMVFILMVPVLAIILCLKRICRTSGENKKKIPEAANLMNKAQSKAKKAKIDKAVGCIV